MEEWKTVEGTDGLIEVSSIGRVRSLMRGKPYILKSSPDKKGYLRLKVTIHRVPKSFKVHRMVAMAFIPNPDNLPQVNHIDGNKANNAVDNLEWITNKDNAHHAIENGLWDSVFEGAKKSCIASRKPVIATKGDQTIRFDSICDAQRFVQSRHIVDVLKGKRTHVKGWSFAYERG